ncbi:MAG TPA: hypothetical protein VF712_00125 [Thermoleophilaceae bacterium]
MRIRRSRSLERLARTLALTSVLALAPATADASTLILRPDADDLAGWTATPNAARWGLLDDAVLAPAPPTTATDYLTSSASSLQIVQTTLANATVPAGETVTGGTAWAYLQTGSNRTITFGASDATHSIGFRTVPAGSPEGWYQVALPETLTQQQVNSLMFTASHSGGSGTANFLYAFYVQLDTPAPPPPPSDPPPSDPPPSDPPPSDPPASDPPPSDPPASDPPPSDPPASDPPASDPPASDPPASDPPASDPPPSDPIVDPTLPTVDPTLPTTDPTVPTTDPELPTVDPAVDPDLPKLPETDTGDIVEPALAITGQNPVATTAGVVPVTIQCPATEVDGCTGVMWLEETLDAGSSAQSIRSARRTNPKRFSKSKKYKLRQGQKKAIPVRLDRRVYRRFKNKRSFKVTVVAQQKDSTGQVLTMRRNVRVFNRKKGKRR